MNVRIRRNQLKNKLEELEQSVKNQTVLTAQDVWEVANKRSRIVERIKELDFLLTKEEEFDIV